MRRLTIRVPGCRRSRTFSGRSCGVPGFRFRLRESVAAVGAEDGAGAGGAFQPAPDATLHALLERLGGSAGRAQHDVPTVARSRLAAPWDPSGMEPRAPRSEEHTSELQSLLRISYAVFCLKKKKQQITQNDKTN